MNSGSAFETFVAGEDRLSSLLRDLPRFEPGETLEARFLETAQRLQAKHSAIPAFEPPESLAAGFRSMAADIDAAQQPRRDAVLQEIAGGRPVGTVIGGALQEAGQKWLKQQAEASPASRPHSQSRPPLKPSRRKWFHPSWRDIQVVGLAAILAAWSTHFYLQRRPTTTETVMLDAFRQVAAASQDDEQEEASSITAKTEEAIKANLQRHPATTPPPSARSAAPRARLASASKPVAVVAPAERSAAAAAAPLRSGAPDRHATPASDHDEAELAATLPEQSSTVTAPPASPDAAATAALKYRSDPAGSHAMEAGAEPLRSHPITTPAPAPAARALATVPAHLTSAPLSEPPAEVAARLPEAGHHGYILAVANPEDPQVIAWIDGLRHALQHKNGRADVQIQQNPGLDSNTLQIRVAAP